MKAVPGILPTLLEMICFFSTPTIDVEPNFIRNTQVKAMTSIWAAKQKARELTDRTKEALVNREGQGTLDVAITVLISIVLGALILAGLYLIVDSTVLPTITQRIKDMFDYAG